MESSLPSGPQDDGPSVALMIFVVIGVAAGLYLLAPLISLIALIVSVIAPVLPIVLVISFIACLIR